MSIYVKVKGKVEKKCVGCKKKFTTPKAHSTRKIYCTPECRIETMKTPRVTKDCDICGKKFVTAKSAYNEKKICSTKCHNKRAKIRNTSEETKKRNREHHWKKNDYRMPKEDELIFYGYKNPLRKLTVKEGYGYDGVVLYSKDAEKIQCHVCGMLFRNVATHANFSHGLKASQYKKKFHLSQKTALVGEKTRVRLIQAHNTIPSFSQRGFTKKQVKAHMTKMSKSAKKKGMNGGWSLEKRNEEGQCPQQLVAKIKRLEKKLGVKPTVEAYRKEYGTSASIMTVYGSWNEAMKVAGYTTYNHERSISTDPKYLLAQMRSFYKKHGRTPRHSDMKRGLVPSHQTYWKAFGSVNKARVLAGVPALIPVGGKWEEVMIPKAEQHRYQKELEKMF